MRGYFFLLQIYTTQSDLKQKTYYHMHMPSPLYLILGIGALASIVRYITNDVHAAPFRYWVKEKTDGGSLYYLITCPWCLSFWLGIPVIGACYLSYDPDLFTRVETLFTFPATILAARYVVGFIAGYEKNEE